MCGLGAGAFGRNGPDPPGIDQKGRSVPRRKFGHEPTCRLRRAMSAIQGQSGKHTLGLSSSQFDPNVWSGRALQVDFAELAVSGLASMYPAFDWSVWQADWFAA